MSKSLYIAKNTDVALLSKMASRHGLITGATGTGKTVTLQKIAEGFSKIGVPVFMPDIKGDLTGIAMPTAPSEKLDARLEKIGVTDWEPQSNPTVLWDVFGEKGHPIRATISDMGPLLISRLLNLNETQSGLMQILFKIANDNDMLLLEIKDLQALIQYVSGNTDEFKSTYGNITTSSLGTIQRSLLALSEQGSSDFFGEPMFHITDLISTDASGKGVINILAGEKLYNMPKLYAMTLLWMLSSLYEQMPELGDIEQPKLVFFFDEAHLLFADSPPVLLEKIERVVRLIRSKGVGIYFVTQNPLDIPEKVLGQLGNRVQHALRAFSPRDQKAVRAAAQTMRSNPAFNTEQAIQELGTGEALISFLDEEGSPSVVQKCFVIAPGSRLGPVSDDEQDMLIKESIHYGKYEQKINKKSAYEILKQKTKQADKASTSKKPAAKNATANSKSSQSTICSSKFGVNSAALTLTTISGVLLILFGGIIFYSNFLTDYAAGDYTAKALRLCLMISSLFLTVAGLLAVLSGIFKHAKIILLSNLVGLKLVVFPLLLFTGAVFTKNLPGFTGAFGWLSVLILILIIQIYKISTAVAKSKKWNSIIKTKSISRVIFIFTSLLAAYIYGVFDKIPPMSAFSFGALIAWFMPAFTILRYKAGNSSVKLIFLTILCAPLLIGYYSISIAIYPFIGFIESTFIIPLLALLCSPALLMNFVGPFKGYLHKHNRKAAQYA